MHALHVFLRLRRVVNMAIERLQRETDVDGRLFQRTTVVYLSPCSMDWGGLRHGVEPTTIYNFNG